MWMSVKVLFLLHLKLGLKLWATILHGLQFMALRTSQFLGYWARFIGESSERMMAVLDKENSTSFT
jgi:hypothetical protein